MDNFNNYLEKKNLKEIRTYLKNSSVDFLKSLAKRYKLPVSTKKKELIISDIIQAVSSDKPLQPEPSIHLMTISQLRNKAKQLNIDYTSLKLKQELRMAILNKIRSIHNNTEEGDDNNAQLSAQKELQSKTLVVLKQIAKTYDIKISKLSKNQIITLILEAQASGKEPKTIRNKPKSPEQQENLNKLSKNELIIKAEELGIAYKKQSKKELLELIKNKIGQVTEIIAGSATTTVTVAPSPSTLTIPITKEKMEEMLKDKKLTVPKIKEVLKTHSITIPKGVTRRENLLKLLMTSSSTPSSPQPSSPQRPTQGQQQRVRRTTTPPPRPKTPSPQVEDELEVVEQGVIVEGQEEEKRTERDEDIVSVHDITSPFQPVPLNDLLEEPTEKQIQDELYRCLQFYEYPK